MKTRSESADPPLEGLSHDELRELFDRYSPIFDGHLAHLEYRVPSLIQEALEAIWGSEPRQALLDLGCGTGLVGEALRPLVERLVGVDISPGMIDAARGKGVYDALVVDELEDYLAACSERFEAFTAGDVLVYVGDPRPLLEGVRAVAQPGAHFAFSTERTTKAPFALEEESRRFTHSPEFIAESATAAGFEVVSQHEIGVRQHAGDPVPGDLFVLAAQ